MAKKKTKRQKTKFAALDPKKNLKSRQDLIDYDYLDKLSPSEMKWLNKFTEEYTNASLDRKNLKNNFHNTKELKKDCDRRANKRKRDLFTALKINNLIDNWDDYKKKAIENELKTEMNELISWDEYKEKSIQLELNHLNDLDDGENKPSQPDDSSDNKPDDF